MTAAAGDGVGRDLLLPIAGKYRNVGLFALA